MAFSGGGSGPAVRVEHGPGSWSLSWPGGLPAPTVDGSAVTYSAIAPGVDLKLRAGATGFSKFLVLKERPSTTPVFDLPLTTNKMAVAVRPDGGLLVTDNAGHTVATSEPAVMWDARTIDLDGDDPSHYAPVKTSIITVDGQRVVRIEPNAAFLSDPATQYPVVVDPSPYLATADAYISSGPSTENTNYGASTHLRLGMNAEGGFRRSLLRFNFDFAHIGKHVVDADLGLWQVSKAGGSCNANAAVEVRRIDTQQTANNSQPGFTASTVTWANRPLPGSTLWSTINANKGYSADCPNGRVYGDVKNLMQYLAFEAGPNYGFELQSGTELSSDWYQAFYSRNYNDTATWADPQVTLTLNSFPNAVEGRDPQEYYSSRRPCLSGTFSDVDGGTGRVRYEIQTAAGAPVADFTSNEIASGTATDATNGSCLPQHQAALPSDGPYKWRAVGVDAHTSRLRRLGVGSEIDWSPWTNITVDTLPPEVPGIQTLEFPADEWSYHDSGTITVQPEPGLAALPFRFTVDGVEGAWTASAVLALQSLSHGNHVIQVQARDIAGNVSTVLHSFRVSYASERPLDPETAHADTGEEILPPMETPGGVTVSGDVVSTAGDAGSDILDVDPTEPVASGEPPEEEATWGVIEGNSAQVIDEAEYFEGDNPCPPGMACAAYVIGTMIAVESQTRGFGPTDESACFTMARRTARPSSLIETQSPQRLTASLLPETPIMMEKATIATVASSYFILHCRTSMNPMASARGRAQYTRQTGFDET